jgi:hypothetical protein
VITGEGYRLGSSDGWLRSNNGMTIIRGKPKELGEKSASATSSITNLTVTQD